VERPLGRIYRYADTRMFRMRFWRDGQSVDLTTGTRDRGEASRLLMATAPQPPAGPWVFVNATNSHRLNRAGQPLLTRSIYPVIQRKVSKLVGRHCWPHLLRHSYAVRLRQAGADLIDIKEELGHASVSTTEIYARIPAADRQKKIARLLEG
jgi:integrase